MIEELEAHCPLVKAELQGWAEECACGILDLEMAC